MQVKELNLLSNELSILYIEDDLELRKQNKEFLKNFFKKIVLAKDGEEALWYFRNEHFDIVIADINIPKIDGISMLKKMKELKNDQKFLITTVYKKEELYESMKLLEIKHFLTKPILTKQLLKKLEEVVKEATFNS